MTIRRHAKLYRKDVCGDKCDNKVWNWIYGVTSVTVSHVMARYGTGMTSMIIMSHITSRYILRDKCKVENY